MIGQKYGMNKGLRCGEIELCNIARCISIIIVYLFPNRSHKLN